MLAERRTWVHPDDHGRAIPRSPTRRSRRSSCSRESAAGPCSTTSSYRDRARPRATATRWRGSTTAAREGLQVYGQALTTRDGLTFTFEDWNLFDEADAWREVTLGTLEEKLDKLADPARRPALRDATLLAATGPIKEMVVLGPKSSETAEWKDHTLARRRRGDRQAPGRLHARHRGRRPAPHGVLRRADLHERHDAEGDPRRPVDHPRRQRRRCAHEVPHRRHATPPSSSPTRCASCEHPRARGGALAAQSALPRTAPASPTAARSRWARLPTSSSTTTTTCAQGPAEIVHDLPGGEWRRVSQGRRATATCSSTARSRSTTTRRPASPPVDCCATADGPIVPSTQVARSEGRRAPVTVRGSVLCVKHAERLQLRRQSAPCHHWRPVVAAINRQSRLSKRPSSHRRRPVPLPSVGPPCRRRRRAPPRPLHQPRCAAALRPRVQDQFPADC